VPWKPTKLEETRRIICGGWTSLKSSFPLPDEIRKLLQWWRAEFVDLICYRGCKTVQRNCRSPSCFCLQFLSLSRSQPHQVDVSEMSETLRIQAPLYSWEKERIGESMRKFLVRRKAMTAFQPKDSSLTVSKGEHLCVLSTSYLVVPQLSNRHGPPNGSAW
jgi:hypothetical protein